VGKSFLYSRRPGSAGAYLPRPQRQGRASLPTPSSLAPRPGAGPRQGRFPRTCSGGISYFFRATFHELPARGLLFRTPQPLALLCLWLPALLFHDPPFWFTELPNFPAPLPCI
jgi:hypothetical protein